MVRIGIIGLGFMGRMHIAAYEKIDGCRVTAIADLDEKRAAGDFTGGWGNMDGAVDKLDMTGVLGTTDFHELINSGTVDAVDICVPTPFHRELVEAALASGKHVLCEKPLALTSDEAQVMADAAAQSSGIFMPAMCMRFWPQWKWLKEAVDDGRYGKVMDAAFLRYGSMPAGWFNNGEMSGGALRDLHVHDTDFVHYVFGMPKAVFSKGYTKHSGAIDHVSTEYIFDAPGSPATVTAKGSWCVDPGFGFTMRFMVNFENATAEYNVGSDPALTVHAGGEKVEPQFPEGDGYEAELAYYVACCAKGEAPTIVTAADAVNSIKIVEAEQRSIDSGAVEAV